MTSGTEQIAGPPPGTVERDTRNLVRALAYQLNEGMVPVKTGHHQVQNARLSILEEEGIRSNTQAGEILGVTGERVAGMRKDMVQHSNEWENHFRTNPENPFAVIHRLAVLGKPVSIRRICEELRATPNDAQKYLRETIALGWVRPATKEELSEIGITAQYDGEYYVPGSKAIIFRQPRTEQEHREKALRVLKVSQDYLPELSWAFPFESGPTGAEDLRRLLKPNNTDEATKLNVFAAMAEMESRSLRDSEAKGEKVMLYNTGAILGLVQGRFREDDPRSVVNQLVVNCHEAENASFPIHAFLNDATFGELKELANPREGGFRKNWLKAIREARLEAPEETRSDYTFVLVMGRF